MYLISNFSGYGQMIGNILLNVLFWETLFLQLLLGRFSFAKDDCQQDNTTRLSCVVLKDECPTSDKPVAIKFMKPPVAWFAVM